MRALRLPKCVMFGELVGDAGCVGGQEKEWMGCFLDNLRIIQSINTMHRRGTGLPNASRKTKSSRDQILRHERGQGNIPFPCSADQEQNWKPYSVDSSLATVYVMTTHICHDISSKHCYHAPSVRSMSARA